MRWNAAKALVKIAEIDRNLPTLTQQLPHLLTLIPTESSQQALSVITPIQARCKYYNYELWQAAIEAETLKRQQGEQGATAGQATYVFPNTQEVKIFERVERYHETPPRSPDSSS